MLRDEADGVPAPDSAERPPVVDATQIPDPDVVDNARFRLATRYPAVDGRHRGKTLALPMEDVRALSAVIHAARSGSERPVHPLDVGAGLVLLGNLRLYLDRLEADLLDGAQQVDLSWDLIAAIIGIPLKEAQNRHRALRARPDPQ
jgi:hypothetical protein